MLVHMHVEAEEATFVKKLDNEQAGGGTAPTYQWLWAMLNAPVNHQRGPARQRHCRFLLAPVGEEKVHYTQHRTIRGPERNQLLSFFSCVFLKWGLRLKVIHHPGTVGDRQQSLVLSAIRHPFQHKPRLAQQTHPVAQPGYFPPAWPFPRYTCCL